MAKIRRSCAKSSVSVTIYFVLIGYRRCSELGRLVQKTMEVHFVNSTSVQFV